MLILLTHSVTKREKFFCKISQKAYLSALLNFASLFSDSSTVHCHFFLIKKKLQQRERHICTWTIPQMEFFTSFFQEENVNIKVELNSKTEICMFFFISMGFGIYREVKFKRALRVHFLTHFTKNFCRFLTPKVKSIITSIESSDFLF